MSKTEKQEKVIVNFGDNPALEELDLPGLLKEYKAVLAKEQFHLTKAHFYEVKRNSVKSGLQTVIEAVHADTVLYTDSMGGEWKSTLVKPDAPEVLDEKLLKTNMMKLGKLAAPVVEEIIKKSTVAGTPKRPYVLVTVPDLKGASSGKNG